MAYEQTLPLEEEGIDFGEYLDALRRRSKSAALIGVGILVVGIAITLLLPNTYKSSATVLIEQPEVPPGLVPTTVTTFAAQQLNYISQRVMTRTNLANIIEKFDLYPEEREYLPTLMLVEDAQEDMAIDVISVAAAGPGGQEITQTIAFTLGFKHESPKVAQQVANELVSLYLAENVRARTVQTAETSEFLKVEVQRLDEEVKEIESEVAEFKRENEGSLPAQAALNMSTIERTETEILEIQRELDAIKRSRIAIEAQMTLVDPLTPSMLADGRPVVAPADQLKAAQTQLAVLEARYNEDHPDIQRVKREIAALEAELGIEGLDFTGTRVALMDARAELAKARERYSNEHPEVVRLERVVESLEEKQRQTNNDIKELSKIEPDNPAYITLQTQLLTFDADIAALETKREILRAKLEDLESRMSQGSDVERQLSAMARRLATASEQYLAARQKLFSAQMGQALETQAKGERFTLVEPPDLPLRPDSPNRPVLFGLFLILALVAGFGWPQIMSMIDGAVSGPRSLERILGAPPIAEIPAITTEADDQKKLRTRLIALAVVPLTIILLLVVVHFAFRPLDVLWYMLVRRFGL